MRICTITCHDVYNVGASLQAYALQTYLMNRRQDVKIIDYKPYYLSRHYRFDVVGNPKYNKPLLKRLYLLAKFPERVVALNRKKKFDLFKKKYLHLTRRYNTYKELEAEPPEADIYFAGSDQIWNPLFENGKDPAFYLDFVKNGVRASYAASFAVNEIPCDLKQITTARLERLDNISVRESSGIDILNSMGIHNGTVVLDPVFLLSRTQWEVMAKAPCKIKDKYLLVYDFDNSDMVKKLAEKIAAEKDLKLFSIFDLPYADKCFKFCGPQGFLGLMKNASFVISNSFHATAFSVIFEKEFIVVERAEKINTRMRDFVNMLDLSDRLIVADKKLQLNNIDWKNVSEKLNKKIIQSKKYINDVLESAES